MMHGWSLLCTHCAREVTASRFGMPYLRDASGAKRHVSFQQLEGPPYDGVDWPHLCLDCGAEILVDEGESAAACASCGSSALVDVRELEGRRCPWCRKGVFSGEDGVAYRL